VAPYSDSFCPYLKKKVLNVVRLTRRVALLPSGIFGYQYVTKIVKGESNDKAEKLCLSGFGTAAPHPIFYKDSERREQRQDGETMFIRLWHCRAASYFLQR